MTTTTEMALDVYPRSTYVPAANLQFNQFLVKDDEPFLYLTGMRGIFPNVHEAVARIVKPKDIRWIGFSHFEVDESGVLKRMAKGSAGRADGVQPSGAVVNLNDFANRPPRGLAADEIFSTGKYRFRFRPTPHLPHGWDAGVFFEETQRTLFCSDLFHQNGDVEPLTESDIVERARQALIEYQGGFLMDYMPFTPKTERSVAGSSGPGASNTCGNARFDVHR